MRKYKERIKHFNQWQEKPFDYEFATHEEQHCNNCGHTFKGNYCPYCSQKAGEGDISWKSVRQSMLDIWGLGSRSLPNTILQLLLRPGYLIGDYISGKRQVSFPPVKMLFIVAVVAVFWAYYILPLFLGEDFDIFGGKVDMIKGFTSFTKGYLVWVYLIMYLLFILPTWVMYRYSPRHTRHTLPQGFFVQIFLLVLNMVVTWIILTPLVFLNYSVYISSCFIVLIIYFFIAYKQLFGYGAWGTLWRLAVVLSSTIYMISVLTFCIFEVDSSVLGAGESKYYLAGSSALLAALILAIGWGINLIATKINRKKE